MALAVPVTLKTTEEGQNERLDYVVSAMQGYRSNMEDAHAIVLNLNAATGTSFFGVYDGHGGPAVSKYCERHLHIELRRHESFRDNLQIAIERTFLRMDEMMKDRSTGSELPGYGGNEDWEAYRNAMRMSRFLPFFQKPAYLGPRNYGCTASAVLIRGNQIIVGNAGNSCCVISRNNQASELSNVFKPNIQAKRQRIEAAGHVVTLNERGNVHRIDDGIAGDLLYKDNNDLGPKKQAITAFPEVGTVTQDDQFLIKACDGIWDYLTRQQEVDFIRIHSTADHFAKPQRSDNMSFKMPGADHVRAHKVLPPFTDQAAANEAVFRILKHQALIVGIVNRIRNTVTFVLDGDNYEVYEQYRLVMAHIRFWFVSNGVSINLRPILGYDKVVHMVPTKGTLHLILRHGLKSVNLVLDAREAWLYGVVGAKAILQFMREHGAPYIEHEYSISLHGDGRYCQIAQQGIGELPVGIGALRTLCSVLAEADEESDPEEIEQQLGVAVVHFMEPLKFHRAYEAVSGSIWSGENTTLDEKDPNIKYLIKIWGKAARSLGNYHYNMSINRRHLLKAFF